MQSEVKKYVYKNGEIQRVHVVRWDEWSQVDFLFPKHDDSAIGCFHHIYKNFLVPTCPAIFPQMIMFYLPEDMEVDFPLESKKYGKVKDKLMAASIALEEGVKLKDGKPIFKNEKVEALWKELEKRDSVYVVRGLLPHTKVIPVGQFVGYLSKSEADAQMKVNANFFIMDPIDCATIYDQVGRPFGLCVKNGIVEQPPLFGREALLVKADGSVCIKELNVYDLTFEINGKTYIPGENASVYTRPERIKTPSVDGIYLVIIGNHIVAIKEKGPVEIPASGFVLRLSNTDAVPGDEVIYHGLEDITFGLQVGNSIVRGGEKTERFISQFYNVRKLEPVPYPPSLYPMDFEKARAARIALGADKDGKPVLFWAEGAGKLHYTPGEDSCGASLSEMAEIAADLELTDAINLDGGGSAQILMNNKRSLLISDRNTEDNSEAERLVPMGLIVK